MNLQSGGELLASIVDLGIIGCTVALLVYALASGMFKSNPLTTSGRVLIAAGLALAVTSHLSYTWLSLSATDAGAQFMAPSVIGWLHWGLSRIAFSMVGIGLFIAWYQRRKSDARERSTAAKLKSAESSIMQSEARYRYLFENTSNSVYCYALDNPVSVKDAVPEQIRKMRNAVLTECNQVCADLLGGDRPADVIGSRVSYFDNVGSSAAYYRMAKAFVENDYQLADYLLAYVTSGGVERAVRVNLTGVIEDRRLVRVWGVETNVLDLQRTQAELERQRDFEELVANVSSRLLMSTDDEADDVVIECLREVCEFGGSDRGSILWQDTSAPAAEVSYVWRGVDLPDAEERRLQDFPFIAKTLLSGQICRIDDVNAMPAEQKVDQQSLRSIRIRSFIALPLIVSGEVVGSATFGRSDDKRHWTDQDMLDMRVFAELFGNFVLRLKSRRALDDAMNRLQEASERLEAENVYLREQIELTHGFDEIIGESDAILHCLHLVEQVADTMTTVLLLGETGTGKELIARAIHEHSPRRNRPLVKVNCAALPANLIESELFGYEKGAFTGAEREKRGRFDLADGSTLFLDEIGEMPVELQAKLLRVLQEGEFERVGGSDTVKVDVRIIAATNRDLHQAVADGEFRSDLFFRINTFPIELPPLRDRGNDVQLLAEHFVRVLSADLGRSVAAISANMMRQLRAYRWPGNVRELEGVIERALIASADTVLDLASPLVERPSFTDDELPTVVSASISDLRAVERDHILSVLEATDWRISGERGAATRLGLPPSTLRSKMKKLSIERPRA